LIGKIPNGHDGLTSIFDGNPISCEFDFSIQPLQGYGNPAKSTGGWLSSFPIFEPHWQITIADALATGYVNWNSTMYNFTDAKFYAEKNWGQSLPSKWYWTQCNAFDGHPNLSVTAGGGIRTLPLGQQESLGMISIHYRDKFYEAVPWTGIMSWNVSTWGTWILYGRSAESSNNPFEVLVEYKVEDDNDGLIFRAPTPKDGMVYFCKDTFEANCTLSLWELELVGDSNEKHYHRIEPPIIDRATSSQGGAEIGGGPWWTSWSDTSKLKQIIKLLLNIPNKMSTKTSSIRSWVRSRLRNSRSTNTQQSKIESA
jgi:tocopherol cyclase